MKRKLYKEYLPELARKTGILLLSNNEIEAFESIKGEFATSIQRNITPSALEHLTNTLIHSKINIVILDSDMDSQMLVDFVEKLKDFDASLNIILIYDEKNIQKSLPVINEVSLIIERSLCYEELVDKLFMILSLSYSLKKLAKEANHKIKKNNILGMGDMDEYLDTYEGTSLFAIEDLSSICAALRSGELSQKLILESSDKLTDISKIFANHERMQSITPILEELSLFLKSLDITKLEPSSLKGFDYLAAILDDVSGALLNMFVDRIFTNVYIIEHSLENNIDFMKNALLGIENNKGGELDFF